MSITPTGQPAWTRTAAHTDYGGHTQKRNYLSRGMIDALTDVGAEELVRMAADLEALARTCPFVTITWLCNDVALAAPTIESVYMMTGVRLVAYAGGAPPTGFPGAVRNGDGDVTFTFDATYADAYGVAGAFTPRHAVAGVHETGAGDATVTLSGNTVRVRAFATGGVARTGARCSLQVW